MHTYLTLRSKERLACFCTSGRQLRGAVWPANAAFQLFLQAPSSGTFFSCSSTFQQMHRSQQSGNPTICLSFCMPEQFASDSGGWTTQSNHGLWSQKNRHLLRFPPLPSSPTVDTMMFTRHHQATEAFQIVKTCLITAF